MEKKEVKIIEGIFKNQSRTIPPVFPAIFSQVKYLHLSTQQLIEDDYGLQMA